MDLERRLDILRQSDMLQQENYEIIRLVIDWFDKEIHIELTEQNASGFVTHLCATLERVRKNEPLHTLNPEMAAAMREEPYYDEANDIMDRLAAILPQLPDSEKLYLAMHIATTLAHFHEGDA